MEFIYNRRLGLEWDDNLYHKLINFLRLKKIALKGGSISDDVLTTLSVEIFPTYGERKSYKEKILFFLQKYSDVISTDVGSNESIHAPKLKMWLEYREKLVSVMLTNDFQRCSTQYINDVTYQIPIEYRQSLIRKMYDIPVHQKVEPSLMQHLKNALHFNRPEICDCLSRCKSVVVAVPDENFDEPFYGFKKDEITTSKAISESSETVLQEQDINLSPTRVCNATFNDFNVGVPKSKISDLNVKHKISNKLHENVYQDVISFFKRTDDENATLILLRKLTILMFATDHNQHLNNFMSGFRVSRLTKKGLLQSLFDDSNEIKESHYSLLDTLMTQRHIIIKKKKQIDQLFFLFRINFKLKISATKSFSDVEDLFYEALITTLTAN